VYLGSHTHQEYINNEMTAVFPKQWLEGGGGLAGIFSLNTLYRLRMDCRRTNWIEDWLGPWGTLDALAVAYFYLFKNF